jgi:hypothetical protein
MEKKAAHLAAASGRWWLVVCVGVLEGTRDRRYPLLSTIAQAPTTTNLKK